MFFEFEIKWDCLDWSLDLCEIVGR